jgi:hypothetical protein
MTNEFVEKISRGDGLTDDELRNAIYFYRNLEHSLSVLGSRFYLARCEVNRILIQLESMQLHREWL